MKRCPYCAEDIQPDAIKCRFCGSMLRETEPSPTGGCPFCKAPISSGARRCGNCGGRLRAGGMGPVSRLGLAFLFAAAALFGVLVLVQQAMSGREDPAVGARRRVESLMESVERDLAAGRGTEKWRGRVKALIETLRRRPAAPVAKSPAKSPAAPNGGVGPDGGASEPADDGRPSRFEPRPYKRPHREGGKSAG